TPAPPSFDEDLGPRRVADVPPDDPMLAAERPIAPQGKGLRTGTIARDRLLAVLDAGPPSFLRQLEVTPRMSGERFVGWELVQLVDRQGPLSDVDLAPGDVLLSVNGQPVSRPDQLQLLWDSLRTANALTAQLWRGAGKLTLEFAIEPKL
ncbi:MAG TPA: PDZ domain-containing protein, partial [Kofleriaceae bacterium]|nr:PDZ domain-containing protein [Kofleriaceae bacterium]